MKLGEQKDRWGEIELHMRIRPSQRQAGGCRSTAATRGQGREQAAREAAKLTAQLGTRRRFLVPHNVTRTQMTRKRNMNK